MEYIIFLLIVVVVYLLYLLNKKNDKPVNIAPIVNKREEKTKRVIIDELEDQFFALDKFNSIKYANPSALKRFGRSLIDKNISSIIRKNELLESIEKAISENRTININVEIDLPSYQFYKIYIIPGPTHLFPEPDSVVLFLKDFTEITKAQKFKSDFVANVSHELRTPLMAIKGSLETIQGPASDDEKAKKKFMKILNDQSSRMENLINDLLILARIELEEHIRPTKSVSINKIFKEIISNFEIVLKKKKITIKNKILDNSTVLGDEKKLNTVFSNLLDNAIKYSPENKNIYITNKENDGKLIEKSMMISIRDEGIGIPQKYISRVTERFFRVDIEQSNKTGGTGLGLAIMKHIVTQHRGDFEILSKENNGTEIKIFLPSNQN
jgi:two-component system phosphate regulon sensor histidine kinase PhoR|tara:strand:- start:929 stop:2077 length:1149 start_codon:yes stop_codon:yes gene_type:complete